jgi:hypothetical protein
MLAVEAYLAEGQFKEKVSDTLSRDSNTRNLQRRTEFRSEVSLKKEQCLEVVHPFT